MLNWNVYNGRFVFLINIFETIAKTASILAAYTTAGATRPAGLQDQTAEETKSPYKWSTQRASAIDHGNNNFGRWYPCQKKCSGKDNKSNSLEVIEIYLFFNCFFFQKEKNLSTLQLQEADVQRTLQNERINLWELEGHIKKVRFSKNSCWKSRYYLKLYGNFTSAHKIK